MGCVVNGPGEAREADLGVASGNGKGQIFVKGEVVKTVPESQIVETLIEEAMRIAEEMGPEPRVARVPGVRRCVSARARPSQRRASALTGRRPRRTLSRCSAPRPAWRPGPRRPRDVLRPLARDPVVNVFVDHRARSTRPGPALARVARSGATGTVTLVSVCHAAANLVPAQATPEAPRRLRRLRAPAARRVLDRRRPARPWRRCGRACAGVVAGATRRGRASRS